MYLSVVLRLRFFFFFFNDTATTEIYTLSLHDALPICHLGAQGPRPEALGVAIRHGEDVRAHGRSEEHTSELQSRLHLVCRLLLEKKKTRCRPLLSNRPTSSPKNTVVHTSTLRARSAAL